MIGWLLSLIGLGGGGLNWTRLITAGVLALAVGGTIYAGYRTIGNIITERDAMIAENAVLIANQAALESAVELQDATIEALQQDIARGNEIREAVERDFSAAREQVQALRDRLSEHELGYLAANRPGLVENIINDASAEVARCFEIATGAPLTEEEINATRPSEINSECPELANPNYRAEE
jgi:hypothetical protein